MRYLPPISAPAILSPPEVLSPQNLLRPNRETESIRQLSCDVVFGSPSANCLGTGICRISARRLSNPIPIDRKRNCQSTIGLFFPIEGGKGLSLVLTRAMLCTKLYKNHLRRGTLVLACPYYLANDITHALGLKFKHLCAGEYKIQENKGFLRIDFILLKN
ncbi:MAG: hypothetical protein ACKVT2_22895 [Saprospiraceae bacterium]